jgi:putative redox protein
VGEKRVRLRHEGGLRFVAATGSGHDVVMDNAAGDSGPRPTELLLVAIAGCTAMDVVEILAKKRQTFTRYAVEVSGVQRETAPNVFTDITVVHVVEGDVVTEAVRRSIDLSATRYCTVSAQVASGAARISHRYLIRRPVGAVNGPAEESAEVAVTGPMKDLLTAPPAA